MKPASEWRRSGLVLLLWWLVLLGEVLAVGYFLKTPAAGPVIRFDRSAEVWLLHHRTPGLAEPAEVASSIGSTLVVAITGAVVALAASLAARRIRPLIFLVVGLVGELGIYEIAVHIVLRPRPAVPRLESGLDPTHSYPSGHTAASVVLYCGTAALAVVLAKSSWRWAALGLLLVSLVVATGRFYVGAHHISDLVVSFAFGSAWVVVTARLVLVSAESRLARNLERGSHVPHLRSPAG